MAWLQELESEKRREKVEAVLVGHSNGGGLNQLILSEGDVKAKALVLVETIPCFGS
jgi:pimeloyl-ACP methyl ester carboxylesterase